MASDDRTVSVDIAICTFHREALLADLVRSIDACEPDEKAAVRILVVDNSDEGTARETVDDLGREVRYPIIYIEAHPPNISVARNAAVAAAQAEVVAFLDDDQWLDPGWLRAVRAAVAAHDADAYFCALEGVFEGAGPVSEAARALFSRRSPLPTGGEVVPVGPRRRDQGFTVGGGNTVFRRETMFVTPDPYDFYLGANGGEDLYLLTERYLAGCRYVYVADALAREVVPPNRTTPRYLWRRFLAGGQSYALVRVLTAKRRRLSAAVMMARSAAQLVLGTPRYLVAALSGDAERRRAAGYVQAGHLGKLTFRSKRVPLYSLEHQQRIRP